MAAYGLIFTDGSDVGTSITTGTTDGEPYWGWDASAGTSGTGIYTHTDTMFIRFNAATNQNVFYGLEAQAKTNPEREQERQRRAAARAAADRVATTEEKRAVGAAERLLREHLSPAQRQDWAKHKRFDVILPSGKRYRLAHGRQHNVWVMGAGQDEKVQELCIVAGGGVAGVGGNGPTVPVPDAILAQKMLLEADEPRFLEIANASRYRR